MFCLYDQTKDLLYKSEMTGFITTQMLELIVIQSS